MSGNKFPGKGRAHIELPSSPSSRSSRSQHNNGLRSDESSIFDAEQKKLSAVEVALAGQVAVVTGGARGIGAACAMTLSRAGAAVIILDRLVAESRVMVETIKAGGGKAAALAIDLSQADQIPEAIGTL